MTADEWNILRVYTRDEWNPENWEKCLTCAGTGLTHWDVDHPTNRACPSCDGHGSLKAAALAALLKGEKCARCYGTGELESSDSTEDGWWDCGSCKGTGREGAREYRCEDCQHPMSEGTWDGHPDDYHDSLKWAEAELRARRDPDDPDGTHYSRCDEKCNHGGPGRVHAVAVRDVTEDLHGIQPHHRVEASWRPVGVRRLSWEHDLRPESLFIGCLRCWAIRTKETP